MTPDKIFRVVYKVHTVAGADHYHARVIAHRGVYDAVVGVLQMNAEEWEAFELAACAASIEIAKDVPLIPA
jgi:hypothetical protein